MGSDKISNLDKPLLRLSFVTKETNAETKKTMNGTFDANTLSCSNQSNVNQVFELDKYDLDKFITTLEDIEKQLSVFESLCTFRYNQ